MDGGRKVEPRRRSSGQGWNFMETAQQQTIGVVYVDESTLAVRIANEKGIAANLVFSPQTASQLAYSLLSGAALCAGNGPKPEKEVVVQASQLPVIKWTVGNSKATGLPVLALAIPGSPDIAFSFDEQAALSCGEALASRGAPKAE